MGLWIPVCEGDSVSDNSSQPQCFQMLVVKMQSVVKVT